MGRLWSRLRDKKGFTLIELIIVVIIVGVLASIALPQYAAFKEKAMSTEAINAIGVIRKAEEIYRMEKGVYATCANAAAIAATLNVTLNTTNWSYLTDDAPIGGPDGTPSCAIKATRIGGTYGGLSIQLYFDDATVSWITTANPYPFAPKN